MARSYNQFNGIGNLAAEPELRDLGRSGRQVCKLRVMFNDSYKDSEGNVVEESFGIDVNVFGDQQIKYLSEYAQKGDRVLIADGTLKIRKYERKEGGDAWATEIQVGPFKGNVSIQTTRKEREERGGSSRDDRGSSRGGRDDDRGGSRGGPDDDRGGSRGGRGYDDRGGSRGGRDYDDRGGRGGRDDGGSRGGSRGGFDPAMDDDVPF
ncbi:single-stranded DNA-binding protein [Sphingomonas sp. 3-13AW]|uniref:single-stranded DNA-binding protein n=1 Tax=Sphingomonas sp. 3-13AW TaxID=3050450 RepID=UPI003BB63E87